MKKLLLSALLVLATNANAAQINSARYDYSTDTVVLNITYGGCNLDSFYLTFGACAESYPGRIHAFLEDSQDICKAIITTEKRFGLDGMHQCRPASLVISTSREQSAVNVQIP